MSRKSLVAAASVILAIHGPGGTKAAQAQGAAPASSPTKAGRMEADLEASRVFIKVTSGSRLGHDHGVIGRLESGWIAPGTGGELVFAMKTFVTDTPEARKFVGLTAPIKAADREKSCSNMLSADVLDVAHYPKATFKIDSFRPTGKQAAGAPGDYRLTGSFTLHGTTRPLTIDAKLEPGGAPGTSRLRGAFSILQTEFGIQPYSALGGLVSIEDKLDIWGEFVVRNAASQAKGTAPKVVR